MRQAGGMKPISASGQSPTLPHGCTHRQAWSKERRDLRIDRVLGSVSEPAFAGVLDELRIEGFRLEETVLIYHPAQTLVVADLVHNVGQPQHWWTKFYAGTMGFYCCVALRRMLRWAAFSDRAAARRSIDELLNAVFRPSD